MNAAASSWQRVPVLVRAGLAVVAGLVVLNLAARALDASVGGSSPGGAPSSSYATAGDGLAAYADLLARWDHPVRRSRGALEMGDLDPTGTLMILDPDTLTEAEAEAAADFARRGGHLVVGGWMPERYLHALLDDPPAWSPEGPPSYELVAEALAGVRRVESTGQGSWDGAGSGQPLVEADDGAALLTVEPVGDGEILLLADVSPLQNGYLTRADNAAFGVLLAGDAGREVVFAEGVHGYDVRRGLGALPWRWRVALAGLGVAALVLMWARGRRLGPPEDVTRPLPPARGQYVAALSATLSRAGGRADALAPVQDAVRRRLLARGGLGADATDEQLTGAGRAAGLDEDEVRALLAPVADDEAALAVGRALARVERWDPGGERL